MNSNKSLTKDITKVPILKNLELYELSSYRIKYHSYNLKYTQKLVEKFHFSRLGNTSMGSLKPSLK